MLFFIFGFAIRGYWLPANYFHQLTNAAEHPLPFVCAFTKVVRRKNWGNLHLLHTFIF
jgi:hypothetical protein